MLLPKFTKKIVNGVEQFVERDLATPDGFIHTATMIGFGTLVVLTVIAICLEIAGRHQ